MTGKKGNSLLETRRRNRVLIKNMIFRMENATRTAIAEELGLTLPTITTSVNEMLNEGILEEIPMTGEQLTNNMGRRPNAIAFRADAAYVIGVELGPYATRAVLMNLRGKVVESIEQEKVSENYHGMLEKVSNIIEKLIGCVEGIHLLGVGVGLPGFIDSENGLIRSNPRKDRADWRGQNLVADLKEKIKLPVFIDNNVRMRAVGHEMEIKGSRPDSFAYFYVSRGVACPIMIKEDVVSGYTAGAGELGHMILNIKSDNLEEQTYLEEVGSEKAIFEKCQEHILSGELLELQKLLEEDGHLTMHQILKVQESGNEIVDGIIEKAIDYLGIALANVVNLLNPGYVVVDSCIFLNEMNRSRLIQSAKSRFFGLNEEEVQIVFVEFDPLRGAKGAGYSVIRKQFLDN